MTLQRTRRNFLKTMSLGIGSGLLANTIPASDFAQGLVTRKDNKKWGVALVGLGSYAKNQLAVGLSQADNCYLAGIVTGSPEKSVEWSKKYNIPSGNIYNYQNFDQITNNKDIDMC
jgi:glucose-fructose oxidoreductase